jgi:serine/threonine protein kinase
MTSERWRKIEELFHAAQELNANGRQAFLAQACQGDDELRHQIEALLAQEKDGQILDRPATELLPATTTHRTAPSLSAGEKLGHYEIVDLVGSGGMGEVYRARDSRLRRNVAIKVLPSEVSRDPERRQRFEREGRSVALLNHPNVVSIYDVGEARGIYFLVTELVDGEPLRTVDLGVRKALEIAVQIASGLASAHQAGIVHRDLKPANILLTRSGQVKILDFGLAKLSDATADGVAQSETVKTQSGMVMGTANYMSPEQLRGGPIDPRSDIFSFGVILYELLSGRRAFAGTSAEAIAAILNHDLPELPETVPPGVRQIVAHCLEKDPAKRFQSASDLGFAIAALAQNSGVIGSPSASAGNHRSLQVWIAAAAVAAFMGAAFAFGYFTHKVPAVAGVHLSLTPPLNSDDFDLAISPDGSRIAFSPSVGGSSDETGLWLRSLASLPTQKLPGTEGANRPFWSPDGRTLGFITPDGVKKLDLGAGQGSVQRVTPFTGYFFGGGALNQHGVVLFQPDQTGRGLYQVAASGGKPSPATKINPARCEIAHRYPQFLPDGRHFLYWVWSASEENTGVYIGSLDQKEKMMQEPLLRTWREAHYAEPGYLLFLQGTALVARPFDPDKLTFTGDPRPLPEHLGLQFNWTGQATFSSSSNGLLVYQEARPQLPARLVLVGRAGNQLRTIEAPPGSGSPSFDPSERNVVVFAEDENAVEDLWRIDLERGVSSRITAGGASNRDPVWSPDGRRIAFRSNRNGVYDLFAKNADGSGEEELLFKSPHTKFLWSWSMDGRFLVYDEVDPISKFRRDIWVRPLQGDRKPIPFLRTGFNTIEGTLSPVRDDQGNLWMAYDSNETGSAEIYLREFLPGAPSGPVGANLRISANGGVLPVWRKDGRELFYLQERALMAVDVKLGSMPQIGVPHKLFDAPSIDSFAVFGNGQRFLLIESAVAPPPAKIDVVLNWTAGLK